MEVKDISTDNDFESMNWHDNYIHSISFSGDDFEMSFDIDYIFQWELNKDDNLYRYWISPCCLTFLNVLNLRMDLAFRVLIGLDIDNIIRTEPRLSPNGKMTIWKYIIETDRGLITFDSTGFIQKVNKSPVLSDYQFLARR